MAAPYLIVAQAFGPYQRGALITASDEIASVLAGVNARFVVVVDADNALPPPGGGTTPPVGIPGDALVRQIVRAMLKAGGALSSSFDATTQELTLSAPTPPAAPVQSVAGATGAVTPAQIAAAIGLPPLSTRVTQAEEGADALAARVAALEAALAGGSGGSSPVNTTLPSLTGSTALGSTLALNPGVWTGASGNFAYSVRRNGTQIASGTIAQGQTGSYVVAGADQPSDLTLAVTTGGVTAVSAALSIPAAGTPQLPAITLNGSASYTEGAAAGTVIADLSAPPTGLTNFQRVFSITDGRVAVSGGGDLVKGLSAITQSFSGTVTDSADGYLSRTLPVTIAFVAATGTVQATRNDGRLTSNIPSGGGTTWPMAFPTTGVGAPAGTVIVHATPLVQGDLMPSEALVMKRASGTALKTQILKGGGLWPDGSLRHVTWAFEDPGIANGTTEALALDKGAPPSAAAVTWAGLSSGKSAGAVLGSQTLDLLALGASASDFWPGTGGLAIQRRVEGAVTGMGSKTSGRYVYDVTLFSDGSVEVDGGPRNDATFLSSTASGDLTGTIAITGGGQTQVTHAAVTLGLYIGHVRRRRWKADGTARSAAVVHINTAYLARVGAIETRDLLNAPGSWATNYAAGRLASSGWNDALPLRGIRPDMQGQGGWPHIGVLPHESVLNLHAHTADARQVMHDMVEAAWTVPWHCWSPETGTWVTQLTHPGRRTTGHNGDFIVSSRTSVVLPDTAHSGSFGWVPWLTSGRRQALDQLEGKANWDWTQRNQGAYQEYYTTFSNTASGPAGNAARTAEIRASGAGVLVGDQLQLRDKAWGLRDMLRVAFAIPETQQPGGDGFYVDVVAANMREPLENPAYHDALHGEVRGIDDDYADQNPTWLAAWQSDYYCQVRTEAARLGISHALARQIRDQEFTAGRFARPTEFNPADGVQIRMVVRDNGVFRKTWGEIGPSDPTYGVDFAATSSIGQDYAQIAQQAVFPLYDLLADAGQDLSLVSRAAAFLAGIPGAKTFTRASDYATEVDFRKNVVPRGQTRSGAGLVAPAIVAPALPGAFTGGTLVSATGDSITADVVLPTGGGRIDSRRVRWKVAGANDSTLSAFQRFYGTRMVVTGLPADTSIELVIYGTNVTGDGPVLRVQHSTTAAAPPPAPNAWANNFSVGRGLFVLSGTAVVSGGVLSMPPSDGAAVTDPLSLPDGERFAVKVTGVGSGNGFKVGVGAASGFDSNGAYYNKYDSQLRAVINNSGVSEPNYDATSHLYLSIRRSGSNAIWETSPTGADGSWTNLGERSVSFDWGACVLLLERYGAGAQAIVFDDVT